jgi:O-methyltransferase involved in polyketide biosynthesis
MKISATSTLVLNWTDHNVWESEDTLSYSNKLDLSEGEPLFKLFSDEETFMHMQAVSGRKYFMKQRITLFLEELKTRGESGQVIILAAGLAPLSIEIASLFPSCRVFDVDQYLMAEKKDLINGKPSNIEFIECDITNVSALNENLLKHGFKADEPTIAVMEGIIYYLPTDSFKNILSFLNNNNMVFAGDFCLKPELVSEKTRYYLTDVFRKIKAEVQLDFINFYTPEEITNLLADAGYKNINLSNMQQIQEERVGETHPFIETNSSWVMNISATPNTLVEDIRNAFAQRAFVTT